LRGWTITTAIAFAAHGALAGPAMGELELLVDPFPAILPDLQAWSRATGHELVEDELLSPLGFALADAQVERRGFR
jgi:hypothetical protein